MGLYQQQQADYLQAQELGDLGNPVVVLPWGEVQGTSALPPDEVRRQEVLVLCVSEGTLVSAVEPYQDTEPSVPELHADRALHAEPDIRQHADLRDTSASYQVSVVDQDMAVWDVQALDVAAPVQLLPVP